MKTISLREAKLIRPEPEKKYITVGIQPLGSSRYLGFFFFLVYVFCLTRVSQDIHFPLEE